MAVTKIGRAIDDDVARQLERVSQERDELLATVRELTHLQLVSRDLELGLRAELIQTRIDLQNAHLHGKAEVDKVRASATWKIGTMASAPLRLAKRVVGRGR